MGMVITLFVWKSGNVVAQAMEPKPEVKRAINLGTKIQYWLQIHSDGSGTVSYGAGGSYQGFFKAGTLDVEKVTKELKELLFQFRIGRQRQGPESTVLHARFRIYPCVVQESRRLQLE